LGFELQHVFRIKRPDFQTESERWNAAGLGPPTHGAAVNAETLSHVVD
jgi:hypothetical protein